MHLTETCDGPARGDSDEDDSDEHASAAERPNLIVSVATTDATVPDATMTEPIHTVLRVRNLVPAEHLLDSGYPSATEVLEAARRWGITLVSPLLADTSPQARAGGGYDRATFSIDFRHTCSWCTTSGTRSAAPARPRCCAPSAGRTSWTGPRSSG